jgi:hypothetical protein
LQSFIEINLIKINKMTHTDYIIIILGASLMLGMGTCVAIREVNRYARPVENVLTRRGDLELVDYIEPTRPQQIYNYPDLLTPEFTTYERISNRVQSY